MTPSLPTFSIASAIFSPTMVSPLAAMLPTWPISFDPETGLERFLRWSTPLVTARSMPRFKSIGFMPAATDFMPSRTIAWARTVAVVVPSPAMSLVFEATSRTICAPMFSNLSWSSISLATVTPSLVMRGAPKLLSRTTLRPRGPSLTFTGFARILTPTSIFSRASAENLTSLAAIQFTPSVVWKIRLAALRGKAGISSAQLISGQHAHDVGFLHDEELLAIELHLGAGPLAEQNAVTGPQLGFYQIAAFVTSTRAYRDHFALRGLLLRRIRNDDAAFGLLLGFDALDDDTIMQGTELGFCHEFIPRGEGAGAAHLGGKASLLALSYRECHNGEIGSRAGPVKADDRSQANLH